MGGRSIARCRKRRIPPHGRLIRDRYLGNHCDPRKAPPDHFTMTMTGDPPLISVCMPACNAERYVAEAIESILGQTLGDFEFLIEDSSTDGTTEILRRYAARDPRIRLEVQPRRGVAGALNGLIERSRGEFLARMDADDVALSERFARQVEYLRARPECVLVGCRAWEVDTDGDPIGEYATLAEHEEIDAFHFQMKGPALLHPTVMMRRDALLAIGKYRNLSMIEDVDLYLRLAEHGRLARMPEFLLMYRVHSDNASRSTSHMERSYAVLCEILTDAYRRRQLPVTLPSPPDLLPLDPPGPERDWAWAWRSLMSGHPRTARKYARRVLARRPLSLESWKLMYCALRGH
jgi:glycosyltransferase involved in cell wall biosynthesis